MTLADILQFRADHAPLTDAISISAHTDCPHDFIRPLSEARRLFAEGFCVCPLTGYVWDSFECRRCHGTGDYRHYPLLAADGYETLECPECGGTGRLIERDYRFKEVAA